jgi:ComF family protein
MIDPVFVGCPGGAARRGVADLVRDAARRETFDDRWFGTYHKRRFEIPLYIIQPLEEVTRHILGEKTTAFHPPTLEPPRIAVENFGDVAGWQVHFALVPVNARADNGQMASLAALTRPVLDFMLPPRCPGCAGIAAADHRFCASCWTQLHFLNAQGCSHCSMPLGPHDGLICGPCLKAPPAYDAVIAGVAYGEISSRVALRLKYARRPGLARTMAAVVADRLPRDGLLVPVPLHRWRLWQRGFNQSAAFARALQQRTGLPVQVDALRRTRATPSLRGLGPGQRQRAVEGAFKAMQRFDGLHIVLVDDVLTTGATANACAKALKRAGAARVTLVCWARVVGESD